MTELVSILIPTYNAEKWIRDTIKSALNQTWLNKEIIIVDDGSTDNTLRFVRQFESKLIKVVTQKNMGAPSARNKALSFAQGDYIQWLDDDDLLAPNKISEQMQERDKDKNTRVLFSGAFGTFYHRPSRAKFIPNSLWQDLTPLDYFLIKFEDNYWLHPSVWLVSRKLTEEAGPWYELRSPDDDGEYFCRIVASCEKVKFVSTAKSYWRVCNLGSLSQTLSDEASEALFLSTSRCINHLRSLEDSERTKKACLKFLHNRLLYFYPDKQNILNKCENIAQELGGHLLPLKVSWELFILKKIFGWKIAKYIKKIAWKIKTYTQEL
jgi:glycosyltransferase involved in cell wall biosynthesis